jgi:tetratricopeptide (TPR) repeat protein
MNAEQRFAGFTYIEAARGFVMFTMIYVNYIEDPNWPCFASWFILGCAAAALLLNGLYRINKMRLNLGNAFLQKRNATEAIAHFQQALQIEPNDPQVQNNLAWLLATCPDASLRDGNKAVELAQQANALTGGNNPIMLHALAAALAETGRFSEAVETAQRALRLAGALESEMKFYQAGQPFHTPAQKH